MSLEAVAGQLAEQKEDNKKNTDSIVKVMDEVAMRTGRSENTLLTIFSDVRKMKNAIQRPTRNPDELEEARENSAYQNELLAVMQGIRDQLANNKRDEEKKDDKKDSPTFIISDKLRLAAVAVGAFAGVIGGYVKPLMSIGRLFVDIFKAHVRGFKAIMRISGLTAFSELLTTPIKVMGEKIMSIGRSIKNGALFVGEMAKMIGDEIVFAIRRGREILSTAVVNLQNRFTTASRIFKSIFAPFGTFFKWLGTIPKTLGFLPTMTDDLAQNLNKAKDVLKNNPITKAFSKVTGFFKQIGGTLKGMLGVFKPVMAVARVLSTPILAIGVTLYSLYKNFTTALDMFKNGDILGGIQLLLGGVVDDLINFFVVDLLNMVKDGFAWIAGKLGFDNIAESLNSFDFGQIYEGLKQKVFDFFGGIWEGVQMIFSGDALGGIKKIFTSIFQPYKDMFNYAVTKVKEMFNFGNVYDMVFGDKEFSLAEIFGANDIDSGTDLKSVPTAGKPTSGQSVRKEVTESKQTNSTGAVVVQDSSQRVVKNTTNGHTSVSMQWSEMDGHDPTIGLRA